MEWRKTIKRVARKRGLMIKDLAANAGYIDPEKFMVACSKSKSKIAADALEIPEEMFLLEALRDSPNLPDNVRLQIIDIITELNPNLMFEQFIKVLKSSANTHTSRMPDGKKKEILIRRALIKVLLFKVGLSYKTVAQLLECGVSTVGLDIAALDDADVVSLYKKISAHVKTKLEIITT